jgi:hypothetical protein
MFLCPSFDLQINTVQKFKMNKNKAETLHVVIAC